MTSSPTFSSTDAAHRGAGDALTGSHEGRALDPESIEIINAYGPYTHGNWQGLGITVGNEEALAGRGIRLVRMITACILETFQIEDLRTLTLVDVGCYDGWITCQLAEALPFNRIIGVEARRKNIDKGNNVRRLLGISTRCEFVEGSIETLEQALGGEKADVVVCVGVLHHLASTADGIAKLHSICRRLLFIETICLPRSFESKRIREALELKDLPYLYRDREFGVTGHKLESGYYDGSATRFSVVSLPSPQAIKMFLEVEGFINVRPATDLAEYSKAVSGSWRSFMAACFTAEVSTAHDPTREITEWIADYEGGLLRTLLPETLVEGLYHRICGGKAHRVRSWVGLLVARLITANGRRARFWLRLLRSAVPDRHAFEILKNLRFAPSDKISVERGKILLARGRPEEAEVILKAVTCRLNADWRSVYRAFCLLAWASKQRGDADSAARYEALCRLANPKFPATVLTDSAVSLRDTSA